MSAKATPRYDVMFTHDFVFEMLDDVFLARRDLDTILLSQISLFFSAASKRYQTHYEIQQVVGKARLAQRRRGARSAAVKVARADDSRI